MNDSFSHEVKNEILAAKFRMNCCRKAMLYGILFGGEYFSEERICPGNDLPDALLCYIRLLKETAGLKKINDFQLSDIRSPEIISEIVGSVGFDKETGYASVDENVMKCEYCGWSFIRGVYLSCGTVTKPDNAYHLEFLMKNEAAAQSLQNFLGILGLRPGITERSGGLYGVYYKDSESIVDLLGHIGATKASFDIVNVKIYKDLRNNANRIANCEAANIGKTVDAANQQIRAIEAIIEQGKEDTLPDELRQTFDLRAAFPNATLGELALMHKPQITKSGVNHRLKRIMEFSITSDAEKKD